MKAPLIGLILSSVCFVLSIGLCGMERNSTSGSFATAGIVLFAVSVLSGGVCLIWFLVALIRGSRK